MHLFDVLNESNVQLRKSESTYLGRLENEHVSDIKRQAEPIPSPQRVRCLQSPQSKRLDFGGNGHAEERVLARPAA